MYHYKHAIDIVHQMSSQSSSKPLGMDTDAKPKTSCRNEWAGACSNAPAIW